MEITIKDFMLMQPNYPKVVETDKYYIALGMHLAKLWDNSHRFLSLPDDTRKKIVLAVMGYFQDIVADSGLWRAFVTMHKNLYGKPLPFYPVTDDYVEFELNPEDLQFIIWYVIEGQTCDNGLTSPFDPDIVWLAQLFYKALDKVYIDAPTPVEYNVVTGIDPDDIDDVNRIYTLSKWLFYNSYLMPHAAKVAISAAMTEARSIMQSKRHTEDRADRLSDLSDRTMLNNPTGPLSLTVGQWIELIASNKLPDPKPQQASAAKPHKFYTQFVNATGGKEIAFFDGYPALEQFLIEQMGWDDDPDGIFPSMRSCRNFVILANHDKGILVAPDVAQCIYHPDNPLYDKAVAASEAYKLVTDYGHTPIDLVRYLFDHHMLPDAVLPGDDSGRLLLDNWDFLARLYQQGFYNGD